MSSAETRIRQRRAAENQPLFRDINERIRDGSRDFRGVTVNDGWLCEWANETCFEHLHLAAEEYDCVRANDVRFIVAPNEAHVFADVERIVDQHERYWVVEKIEAAAQAAERLA
jgi:hypothetical protein